MLDFWSRLFGDTDSAEDRAARQNEFVRLLLDSMAAGLYVINQRGECIECNDRCNELLGYQAKDELLGRNMHDLIHHTRRDGSPYDQSECHIFRAFCLGERVHVDDEVLWRNDGSSFDAEYSSYPLLQNGVVTGAVVTFFDITERRKTEADLRLRTRAIDEAINGVLITDATRPDNPIVYMNSTFTRLTGYTSEELEGKNCRILQGADTDREAVSRIRQAVHSGCECREVLLNYRKDGTSFWNELLISPVHDESGKLSAFIGIQSDVTDRVENQLALEEARRKAEAASRAKSEFLSHISHELRSPMTAILGFAELLQTQGLDAAGMGHAQTIHRNGEYLLRLVNDILDISRIEAGRLQLEVETVDLPQLLEEVRSLMSVKASERSLEFAIACRTTVPARIDVDPIRLRQVLVNLLSNAFKFTDHGRVDLLVSYQHDVSPPLLMLAVRDTGIGIPESDQVDLFEPFTQVAGTQAGKQGGTGLGLSISHRLVNAMGGEIKLESEQSRGSTFTVQLPLRATSPGEIPLVDSIPAAVNEQPATDPSAVLLSGNILVADDRRDIRHLLKHFLTRAGATVECVENGADAVERLSQSDGDPGIALLLLDMQMPTMNGYEAASRLRSAGFQRPIIALTANAQMSEREKCLAAGCDDFLTKPVDSEELLRTVDSWLTRQPDSPLD